MSDTIGVGVLGEVPTCNRRCYVQGDGPHAYPEWDRDCPIHGDFADQQEAPPAEGGKDITPPAGDETDTTREDTAR